jgi:hypothetical protein
MKQLLLATAALVGMSSAALAAEPVALTDSQLDNVTAGQTIPALPADLTSIISPQALLATLIPLVTTDVSAATIPSLNGPNPGGTP